MENFAHNHNLETIYPTDNNFPPLLREITDPPKKLYARGDIKKLREISHEKSGGKILCVVGSRSYTNYGKETLEKLIAGLKGYNVCIVSGLALGIDSIAHRAALDAELYTVAFPGSGLDPSVIYPQSHAQLAEEIVAKGGALVSEFEPMIGAAKWTFPRRNRLMAGVSHATLVVECGLKSGTLITSARAMDYNRDVGAIPGPVFAPLSAGPHMLLSKGAKLIACVDDLLELLGFARRDEQKEQGVLSLQSSQLELMSEINKKVILFLQKGPCSKDKMVRDLEIETRNLNTILSSLELDGFINEEDGVVRVL